MKFHGILLKESLQDESVLSLLDVNKTETWNVANATNTQPKVWHAIYYSGDGENADMISTKLSRSLKEGEWYTNFSNDNYVYVIFPGKVFKYTKGEKEGRNKAIEFGQTIGIEDSQLDWEE